MILNILNTAAILLGLYLIKTKNAFGSSNRNEIAYIISLTPTEINYLTKNITYLNRGILVTLLDLKRRGNIEIEKYIRDSRNKALEDYVIEYKFTLLNKNNLKRHEEVFLENIFKDKVEVTTDELTQRAVDGKAFLSAQGEWANEIEKELKSLGIYSTKNQGKSNQYKLIGLLLLVISIYSLVNNSYLGIATLVASLGVFLIGIELGINRSSEGSALLNSYYEMEERAKKGEDIGEITEVKLLELLGTTLTMKYFLPIYKNSKSYDTIDIVTDTINENGGSAFDDAILRGFMGYTVKTRNDTLDTNRIDYRLFK